MLPDSPAETSGLRAWDDFIIYSFSFGYSDLNVFMDRSYELYFDRQLEVRLLVYSVVTRASRVVSLHLRDIRQGMYGCELSQGLGDDLLDHLLAGRGAEAKGRVEERIEAKELLGERHLSCVSEGQGIDTGRYAEPLNIHCMADSSKPTEYSSELAGIELGTNPPQEGQNQWLGDIVLNRLPKPMSLARTGDRAMGVTVMEATRAKRVMEIRVLDVNNYRLEYVVEGVKNRYAIGPGELIPLDRRFIL